MTQKNDAKPQQPDEAPPLEVPQDFFVGHDEKDPAWILCDRLTFLAKNTLALNCERLIAGVEAYEALLKLRKHRSPMRESGTPWQPIETAPKDGTKVLMWCDGEDVMVVAVYKGGDSAEEMPRKTWRATWEHADLKHNGCTPTHWMPLPAVPDVEDAQPIKEKRP